jgi:hypothetical protein
MKVEVAMLRFVKGTLLAALVVTLGLGSAGCGGETAKPTKQDPAAIKAGMEKMEKQRKEMAEKQGQGDGAADKGSKDKADANKEKDKDKNKEKKEKDKD